MVERYIYNPSKDRIEGPVYQLGPSRSHPDSQQRGPPFPPLLRARPAPSRSLPHSEVDGAVTILASGGASPTPPFPQTLIPPTPLSTKCACRLFLYIKWLRRQSLAARAMAVGGPGEGRWGVHWLIPPSAVGSQLCLNVHSADGTFLAHGEPLVHTQLVEEMHTGEAPGREGKVRGLVGREGSGAGPGMRPYRLWQVGGPTMAPLGGRSKRSLGTLPQSVRLWLGWEVTTGRSTPWPSSSMKPLQTSLKQSHDFVLHPPRPNSTVFSYALCPLVQTNKHRTSRTFHPPLS